MCSHLFLRNLASFDFGDKICHEVLSSCFRSKSPRYELSAVSRMLVSNANCQTRQKLLAQCCEGWIAPQVVEKRDEEQMSDYHLGPEVRLAFTPR